MTVYVDDMYLYDMGKFYRMKMSHMIADKDEELHRMAEKIGLRRKWFQGDHYDVSMSKREEAIRNGAVPISLRTLACMDFCRRANGKLPRLELAEITWYRTQHKLRVRREKERRQRALEQKGAGWRNNAAKIRQPRIR